mmetsp:Transcript_28688/g.53032  ORF Transcript_28688/g.53032 Transcript_28688/m.53032 type:complete len:276 (-) Transcript_28688:311-1138(-)
MIMTPLMNRWLLAVITAAIISAQTAICFTSTTSRLNNSLLYLQGDIPSATRLFSSSTSTSQSSQSLSSAQQQPTATLPNYSAKILDATLTLQNYDQTQQQFIKTDGNQGMGGGLSALHHIQSLSPSTRTSLQNAIRTLIHQAHLERAGDSSKGRIMLGICAANAPEALSGLKSWVSSIDLPRGMLHGMDIDGVPIPVEDLGAVYVKYSTGGAMTFGEMRRSGRGFDALWRPGDALLEPYDDGDFRGVYVTVELEDGEFRQFGVLPTDLFMEEEEW